ncbi:MAG TPA: phosphopyruvate hydratase [Bacilli bacterium]|nr:phosphopyruvate hydratase [Bacilli bacterium]
MRITKILAREILDSRGNPTIEVQLEINHKSLGRASVPSGASTGEHEALELRDNDLRYHGKGVLKAVYNVEKVIAPEILNKDFTQEELDKFLIELDGTENKSKLGANSILAVSLAFLKACAKENNQELYQYVGKNPRLPRLMLNILNGGMHADNNILCQEFMIIPLGDSIKESVRMASEIFHTLKKILKIKNMATNVGDEGGFAPNLENDCAALDVIIQAIKESGYDEENVKLALDVAASSFYNKEKKTYEYYGSKTTEQMIEIYKEMINKYPIISIEDPLDENDWEGFKLITERLGADVQLVGDDLFVTNEKLLQKGIDMKVCNAILIKANQIGSVTETIKTIKLAKEKGYKTIMSHRSGETLDTFISDLSVGLMTDYIKTGSITRGERIAKYNRLMEIEEDL